MTAALLSLALFTTAWWLSYRRSPSSVTRRHATNSLRTGMVFGGLILAVAPGLAVARFAGLMMEADLGRRLAMALLGGYFVYAGNTAPKMLTPLSALGCSGARAQAVQRFIGWTWVVTGLAFAAVWLMLPITQAQPVAVAVLTGGALAVLARTLWMWRSRPSAA